MKYLLLLITLLAPSAYPIDLILGGVSKHLHTSTYKQQGKTIKFNAYHNIKGAGFRYNKYYFSAINFKNSFYRQSTAISVGYKVGPLYVGGTLSTGYEHRTLPNVGNLLLAPSVKYSYKYISIATMGRAILAAITIPIKE